MTTQPRGGRRAMPEAGGLFILAELRGAAARRITELQREFDPKLAAVPTAPHITLAGSSGLGVIEPGTPHSEIESAIRRVAAEAPELSLPFQAPHRFMATNIIVLPLDPHGPIRQLHDRIAACGLRFLSPRFTFTPHCTLSFYPTLSKQQERELLARRVHEPAEIASLSVYRTRDPATASKLLSVQLAAQK